VVREQTAVSLESLAKATTTSNPVVSRAPGTAEQVAAKWPVDKLTEADIQLAEALLQRYNDLPNGAVLANQILNRLLERMEQPTKPPLRRGKPSTPSNASCKSTTTNGRNGN
jgi:hypothetical protein